MDIANDGDGRLYVYDIALLHEQFLRLSAHRLDDRVGQQLLAVQSLDTFVQVYAGCEEVLAKAHVPRAI